MKNVNISAIWECMGSTEGNAWQHEMAVQTAALSPAHQYVPWIVINGVHTEKLQVLCSCLSLSFSPSSSCCFSHFAILFTLLSFSFARVCCEARVLLVAVVVHCVVSSLLSHHRACLFAPFVPLAVMLCSDVRLLTACVFCLCRRTKRRATSSVWSARRTPARPPLAAPPKQVYSRIVAVTPVSCLSCARGSLFVCNGGCACVCV